jgi:phage gp16-like protein
MIYEHIAEMVRHAETDTTVEINRIAVESKQAEIETARTTIASDVKTKVLDVLTKQTGKVG